MKLNSMIFWAEWFSSSSRRRLFQLFDWLEITASGCLLAQNVTSSCFDKVKHEENISKGTKLNLDDVIIDQWNNWIIWRSCFIGSIDGSSCRYFFRYFWDSNYLFSLLLANLHPANTFVFHTPSHNKIPTVVYIIWIGLLL